VSSNPLDAILEISELKSPLPKDKSQSPSDSKSSPPIESPSFISLNRTSSSSDQVQPMSQSQLTEPAHNQSELVQPTTLSTTKSTTQSIQSTKPVGTTQKQNGKKIRIISPKMEPSPPNKTRHAPPPVGTTPKKGILRKKGKHAQLMHYREVQRPSTTQPGYSSTGNNYIGYSAYSGNSAYRNSSNSNLPVRPPHPVKPSALTQPAQRVEGQWKGNVIKKSPYRRSHVPRTTKTYVPVVPGRLSLQPRIAQYSQENIPNV